MTSSTRWLSSQEDETWRAVWAMMTWLPVRLDAQLRDDAGLSLAEYHALSQISEAPERTLRLSTVAARANMTLSHLSRVITRLADAGWIIRSPDPDDGRYTRAHLTEAGWGKLRAVAPSHVEAVRQAVFDNLTADQARTLGQAAGRVVEAVAP
ncbi:MAG: MarR family winged helix-turn-helix transcriptional regulator, partial [Nesterenkonia sp.]